MLSIPASITLIRPRTYTDGESETTRWQRPERQKRDKVFLTSKTIAQADDNRASMMKALEGSMRRLQTDHIDVYFNHAGQRSGAA